MALALSGALRTGDTVARLGGDEFAVLLPDGHDENVVSMVAARMVARVAAIKQIEDHQVQIGASAGLAMYPNHAQTCEELLANADYAMYQAKAAGKGQFRWFVPAAATTAPEASTKPRFDTAELELRFQPWFQTNSSACAGIEALVRQRGAEHAESALQLARRHNALRELDNWVLDQACRMWLAEYHLEAAPPRLAINVSREDLEQAGFTANTLGLLGRLGFPPGSLQLEVAEAVFDQASDFGPLLNTLAALQQAGVHVAIDQFGSNPASLGRLPTLPVDVIKLDMRHMQNLRSNPATRSYFEGVLAFAGALKRELIICGVESPGDLASLHGLASSGLQGFGLAAPMSVAELRLQRP